MSPHERALMLVLELLCAVCFVAALVALVKGELWALVFAACAWGCYEAAGELDQ